MPYKAKWSREQRLAIEHAHLVHGWSGERVHRACQAGTLPGIGDRLPPFPIALSTVRDYITQARRQHDQIEVAAQDPAAVLSEQALLIAVHYKRLVERRTREKKQLSAADLSELARAGKEVHSLLRALDPGPKRNKAQEPGKTPQTEDAEEPAPDFLDTLAGAT